jgi:hypothetical protein
LFLFLTQYNLRFDDIQFELQQEDFPPLPHRSQSHEGTTSTSNTNGYTSSQSPIAFQSSIDALHTLMNRHNKTSLSQTNHTATSAAVPTISSSTITTALATTPTSLSQSGSNICSTLINTNGLPISTITDQYGLAGLLQMIQKAEKSPDTSMLLNYDLTTLGLSRFLLYQHVYH